MKNLSHLSRNNFSCGFSHGSSVRIDLDLQFFNNKEMSVLLHVPPSLLHRPENGIAPFPPGNHSNTLNPQLQLFLSPFGKGG